MSWRASGSTNHARRTDANLPSTASFTIMGLSRVVNDRNGNYRYIGGMENTVYPSDAGSWILVGWTSANNFHIAPTGAEFNFPANPTSATGWFWWGLSVRGTASGDVIGYWRALNSMSYYRVASTASWSSFTPGSLMIHSDTYDEWIDGECQCVKIYNRFLSGQEWMAETMQQAPVNYLQLNDWYRFSTFADFGGNYNGRAMTAGGTLTTAAVPDVPYLQLPSIPRRMGAAAPATAALTGTITASATESDIVTGGKTIILTLTGDTWVASGATFDAQRQNIINGIDSAQSEANGWDAVVKATQGVSGVVRTSDTVVTITFDAFATYNITAQETITATIPATALSSGSAIVAAPTFTVSATAGAGWGPLLGLRRSRLVRAA